MSQTTSMSRRWGLKSKLILSMLFVGVVPLMVGLGMAFWQGSQEIREVSGESFKALATEAARKLDLLVAEEVIRTSRIANDPVVIRELERQRDALAAGNEKTAAHRADMQARWDARDPALVKAIVDHPLSLLLREYYTGTHSEADQLLPQVVRSATKMLFLTDTQGTLVATMTADPNFHHKNKPWWQGAYNKGVGQLYIEDVYFESKADAYVFSISVPVMDALRYEVVGAVHRVIDAKEFFSPSTHVIRFGKTGHVMLIDSNGVVMSCPILPTGVSLSDKRLVPLVTPMHPGWVQAPGDGHGGKSTSVVGFAPLPETSRSTNGALQSGSWHTFVWQSSDELFAPIEHLFTWVTVFGTVAIALLASLGYVAASRIVTPVRQLQEAAKFIGRGQLRSDIAIHTGDELEDLAEEFNRMNKQLEAAFAGLTSQVQLKTEEVEYLQQSTDQILDTVPTPILLIDAAEHLQYANRAARDAFAIQDLTSALSLFTVLPVSLALQQKLREEFQTLLDPGAMPVGEQPLESPQDPLTPSAEQRTPLQRTELQIGARQYHYQWFRLPGWTGTGNRIGIVFRDTTDESRLQDQLVQAEKTGSLRVLTAGIGHELNNPLFGIVGLGEAIQDEGDLERARAYARDIVAQGRRMAKIIQDFTGVASQEITDRRIPVCLEQELDQALAAMQTTTDINHLAVHKTYAGPTRVLALPDQLRQAFANLLMNAAQAMRKGGTLTLTTTVANGLAVLTVADTGPGISKQHLSKIFDPFFTTKGQGEGSGLGLTVARRILRKFGGDVRIDSLEGRGTTCVVTLPAIPSNLGEGPWTTTAPRSEPQPSHSS